MEKNTNVKVIKVAKEDMKKVIGGLTLNTANVYREVQIQSIASLPRIAIS